MKRRRTNKSDSLPPLDEMDFFFEMQSILEDFLIMPLIDLIKQYLQQPMTQLQKAYNPQTRQISDELIYYETRKFFKYKTDNGVEQWYKDNPRRKKIALENLRFRVDAYARQHNIPEMVNPLPCQLVPTLTDVVHFLMMTRCHYSDLAHWYVITCPYLAWLALDSRHLQDINFYDRWPPEQAIEFLFRRYPDVMDSPHAYMLTAKIRPNQRTLFNALVARLPVIEWQGVDPSFKAQLVDRINVQSYEWRNTWAYKTLMAIHNPDVQLDNV